MCMYGVVCIGVQCTCVMYVCACVFVCVCIHVSILEYVCTYATEYIWISEGNLPCWSSHLP